MRLHHLVGRGSRRRASRSPGREKAASLAVALVLTGCAAAPLPELDLGEFERGVALRGVNLAGAEFAPKSTGRHGKDYIYPVPRYAPGYQTPTHLAEEGFNTFRLPFLWERLQPQLTEPLDRFELGRLKTAVQYLNGLGAYVVVDPHNYARYRGEVIGVGVTAEALGDLWRRLAAEFANENGVIFGLMNEPHTMPTEDWVEAANVAITEIRSTGAANLILVPGNHWTGAHAWAADWYGTANAEALLTIRDPLGFLAFEAHQYINPDSSGSTPDCIAPAAAVKRLVPFTRWLKEHGKIGFLGEFGGGPNENCLAAVDAMLQHVQSNADVYVGWTAWAAGPWWPKTYHLSLEPDSVGRAQLELLSGYATGLHSRPEDLAVGPGLVGDSAWAFFP